MSKFKMGDTIFYMSNGSVESKKVVGIVTVQGKMKVDYDDIKTEDGESVTLYKTEGYSTVKEEKAFGSANALKNHLFPPVKNSEQTSK